VIHVIRVLLNPVLHFLVCAAQVRGLAHRLLELLRLLPELIQVNFALFQREDKLLEGVTWVHKSAIIPLWVGTRAAAASETACGLAMPQVVVGDSSH
jgi:hypothetical protein